MGRVFGSTTGLALLICTVGLAQQVDFPQDPRTGQAAVGGIAAPLPSIVLIEEYKELAPALVGMLGADDAEVREYAAASLMRLGRAAVVPLVEGLHRPERDVQANACYLLGYLVDSEALGRDERAAIPRLLKLAQDKDAEVSRRGAFCLYRVLGGGRPQEFAEVTGFTPQPAIQVPVDPGLLLPAVDEPAFPGLPPPPPKEDPRN